MLLLTSKNTQILGGYVEDLLEKNASIQTALVSLWVWLDFIYKKIVYWFDFFCLDRKQHQNQMKVEYDSID